MAFPLAGHRPGVSQRRRGLIVFDAVLAGAVVVLGLVHGWPDASSWGWGVLVLGGMFAILRIFAAVLAPASANDFASVPLLGALLALDGGGAMIALLVGSGVATLVDVSHYRERTARQDVLGELVALVGVYGLPALLASALFRWSGGELPLAVVTTSTLFPLVVSVAGYVMALHSLSWTRRVLVGGEPARAVLVTHANRGLWVSRLLSLPMSVVIALFYHEYSGQPAIFALIGFGVVVGLSLAYGVWRAQRLMQRHLDELAALNRISQAITTDLAPESLLHAIYTQAQALCPFTTFVIAFYDEERDSVSFPLVMNHGSSQIWPERALGSHLLDRALIERQPVLLPDRVVARTQGADDPVPASLLAVPLMVSDQPIGVVALQHDERQHVYGEREKDLLTMVAAQAAVAIRNARLCQDSQLASDELNKLVEVSRAFNESLDLTNVAQTVVQRVNDVLIARAVALFAWEQDDNPLRVLAATPGEGNELAQQLLSARRDLLYAVMTEGQSGTEMVFSAGLHLTPLMMHDWPVGAIALWESPASPLTVRETRLIEGIAHQAAAALHNAARYSRTDASLQERVIELSTIEVISRRMSATLDVETIAYDLLAAAMSAIDATLGRCALAIDAEHYKVVARLDAHGARLEDGHIGRLDHGITGRALRTRQPINLADTTLDPDYVGLTPGMRSELCIPIVRDDRVIGVLDFEDPRPGAFTDAHVRFVRTLGEHAAIAIENVRLIQQIRAGRDQVQAILDSTREAMLLFDTHARLMRSNRAAQQMLGMSLEPFFGQNIAAWLRATGPRQLKAQTGYSVRELRAYIQGVTRQPQRSTQRQFEQVSGDQRRAILETGTPVLDHRGQPVGWLIVWRDITEEHELQLLRQEFTNMIIHDLRNPLTSIVSSMVMFEDLLTEEPLDAEVLHEVLHVARTSTENMLSLVESLLDIARLEQRSLALSCARHSLADAVDFACTSVLSLALGADIALTVDVPEDIPEVWFDEDKVHRILINLLDNALRHTPSGGEIRVEAARWEDGRQMLVRVVDTGPGIPAEARTRIFEKFTQLEREALRGHRGTGLGLAFCQLAVEAHGGRIWVDDGPEKGAAFCFTLPLAPLEP